MTAPRPRTRQPKQLDAGILQAEINSSLRDGQAGRGAWRPRDMRVPRPERLPRHSYSESRFRP
jgi:hypothetical protein